MFCYISPIQALKLQLNMSAKHSCKLFFFGLLTLQSAADAAEVEGIGSAKTVRNSMPRPLVSKLKIVTLV